MKKEQMLDKKNRHDLRYNLMITMVTWGYLIISNYLELYDINIDIKKYIFIMIPIYVYLLIKGNFSRLYSNGIVFIFINIFTLLYFLMQGSINNNLVTETKYYYNMIHTSMIVLPIILLNIEKFDINYYSNILRIIIMIFSWLAFIEIASNGFIINSRFLNGNITGFLVCQYIIISLYANKNDILSRISRIISIIVVLACGTRTSMIALLVSIIPYMFRSRNILKTIRSCIIIVMTYMVGFKMYYKLIKVPKLWFYLRPLGTVFLDQNNILDKASMGRVSYFEEYFEIIFLNTKNFIFGVGPNSFSNYSHNLFIDLLGFGGLITLIIYIFIGIYIIKVSKPNILLYQFVFFTISFLGTSSMFINSVYFAIALLIICLSKENIEKRISYEL